MLQYGQPRMTLTYIRAHIAAKGRIVFTIWKTLRLTLDFTYGARARFQKAVGVWGLFKGNLIVSLWTERRELGSTLAAARGRGGAPGILAGPCPDRPLCAGLQDAARSTYPTDGIVAGRAGRRSIREPC